MEESSQCCSSQITDIPCYYKVCDEQVTVGNDVLQGTIRAAPRGECRGVALVSGSHPYVCEACEALQHGKNSHCCTNCYVPLN